MMHKSSGADEPVFGYALCSGIRCTGIRGAMVWMNEWDGTNGMREAGAYGHESGEPPRAPKSNQPMRMRDSAT